MNRIYQGRVSRVELNLNNKKNDIEWREPENGFEVLWRHHDIFQDAVNYYLVALGALASEEYAGDNRVVGDLRTRLKEAWDNFPRNTFANPAKSLRDSIVPWLGLDQDVSIERAFETILGENIGERQINCYALMSLLADLGGDGKIQQGGREYLPYFCVKNTKANFPRDEINRLKKSGKEKVSLLLSKISNYPKPQEMDRLKEELRIEYFAKPVKSEQYYSSDETLKKLRKAVDHFVETKKISDKEDWLKKIDQVDAQLRKYGGINKEPLKNQFYAWLLFVFVEQSKETLRLLKSFYDFTQPTPRKDKNKIKRDELEELLCSLGGDPISMARGKRGFVFSAFTATPLWSPDTPGEPKWKEFDIAAFKEAIKALNQFKQKTGEREEERQKLELRIAWMTEEKALGATPDCAESEEELETSLPRLAGDPCFALAQELEIDLAEKHLAGDDRFRITRAALRGFKELSALWNKCFNSFDPRNPEAMETALRNLVTEHQKKAQQRGDLGSVPLFLELCKQKYWRLWRNELVSDEETESGQPLALNVLYAMANLHSLEFDLARKSEPIKLTPAEARHSRRLFCFTDLMTPKQRKETVPAMNGGWCEVPVVVESNKRFHRAVARLYFSAPRLHRDELIGGSEPRWLQPMMSALNLDEKVTKSSFDKISVSLMPEVIERKGKSDRRFLLNFSITLNNKATVDAIGVGPRWTRQFNGTKDQKLHLNWPAITPEAGNVGAWWLNPLFLDRGFFVLANDLGQRSAGAWSLLYVSTKKPQTSRPFHPIGEAGGEEWFAEVLRTGLYRLPGENERDFRDEKIYPTRRGRSSSEVEYSQAAELARALGVEDADDAVKSAIGASAVDLSLPEQNDRLIKLANRCLSQLATYHRWSCYELKSIADARQRDAKILDLKDEIKIYEQHRDLLKLLEDGSLSQFQSKVSQLFLRLRRELQPLLVQLADRVAPLRDRSWTWVLRGNGSPYGDLVDCGPRPTIKRKIKQQRGLSLKRIEQLQNLRKLFLRYNRALDRAPGEKAAFGKDDKGRQSGEPCQALLAKIERMKDERINLTAHLILSQALGLRLKREKEVTDTGEVIRRDLHGEYERDPKRSIVDMIVLEDLRSYGFSKERGPGENKRLMSWAHRAVLNKVKELNEPFGVPVVETLASYSSRYCSRSCEPGFRAFETHDADDVRLLGLKRELERDGPNTGRGENLAQLFAQLEQMRELNALRAKSRKLPKLLLAPQRGGPLFIAVESGLPSQADINAATNLGLRAIAAPEAFHIHNRIRTVREVTKETKGEFRWRPRATEKDGANKREKAVFSTSSYIGGDEESKKKLEHSQHLNFFIDPRKFGKFCRGSVISKSGDTLSVCSGEALWSFVNQRTLSRCLEINALRLKKWSMTAPPESFNKKGKETGESRAPG